MIWEIYDEITNLLKKKWKEKEAENLANLYLSTNPYNLEAYMGLIDIFMNTWKYKKVHKILDFLIKSNKTFYHWTNAFFYYFKAVVLLEESSLENNVMNFETLLEAQNLIERAIKIEKKKYNQLNPEYARIKLIINLFLWDFEKNIKIVKKLCFEDKIIVPEIIILWIETAEKINDIDFIKKLILLYETNIDNIQYYLSTVWEWERIVEYNKIINSYRNLVI